MFLLFEVVNKMIYVPQDYNNSSYCITLNSNNVLRVYTSQPTINSDVAYRDFMLDNHYIYRDGVAHFSQYSTLPTCYQQNEITSNWGYRTDLADILVCLGIIVFFGYFCLSRPLKWMFRGVV